MSAEPGTRRTIFAVEREKRWRIWLLFGLLLAMVFAIAWVPCVLFALYLYQGSPEASMGGLVSTVLEIGGLILGVSLVIAVSYWFIAQIGARDRLLRAMHCKPLDSHDRYHQRLADVVEEMRLATGMARIECYSVATLGLNAFSFSDLRGGGAIGVTEGALARLSRQQLEGVVAHEFAHIVSGSYITATVSCMLFGIYSSLGESLEEGGEYYYPIFLLRGWLALMELASSVPTAALNWERERQADVAAARFTRDPLSLAEALRIIGRHPGGAGYIPEGLAPLCIRDTQSSSSELRGGWRQTHPPIDERVDALLALAHVSPGDFDRQVERAAETFDKREHWSPSPGATAAGSAPSAVSSAGGAMTCPSCGAGLQEADYEGLRLFVCASCGGRLAGTGQVERILARREVGFSDEQQHLADLLAADGDRLRRAAVLARGHPGVGGIACPKCGATMLRRHFNYVHAVEIDYCLACSLYWFEKDELEALQILCECQSG